ADNGIELPDRVIADGKIQRFRLADESKGKFSGAYKLYTNGRPAGFLQNFKSDFKENWKFTSENYRAPVLTPEQRAIQKQAFERQQQQFLLEQQQSYDNAAKPARKEWNNTQTAIDHPYLTHKGVKAHHARINEYNGVQQLIIPLQNKEGKLVSLQRIKLNGVKEDGSPTFSKMNMKDGKKSDAFSILNRQEHPKIIAIAEGFATTASVIEDDFAVKHRIMGVMAVDADNLKSVAKSMRELHPTASILVFADMGDHLNKGELRAKAAAEAVGGFAVLPPIEKGDMNDYLTGKAGEITATLEQLVNGATNDLLAQSKIEKISNKDVQPETLQKTTSKESVIKNLAAKLNAPEGITKAYLTDQANLAFDGSMADGTHSFKDAYDLMEAAVNIHLLNTEQSPAEFNAKTAAEKVVELTQLVEKLPTQTVRDPEMDRMQQFSTPPALAFAANWVANINNTDTMLEPSAGTGDLAIWAKRAGANIVLNELSDRRAETLKAVFPEAQIFKENAEQLNNILPDDVKPTVIVMNPPFSTSVGVQSKNSTSNGAKHIEQALLRLAENGRLVAIVGQGMAADKPTFNNWWRDIQSKYNVRANIGISGKEYAKYGTTFDNQLIVIDKNGATTQPVLTGKVESVSDLPTLLEAIKNERPTINLSEPEHTRVEPTSHSSAKTSEADLQPSLDLSSHRLDDMGSDRTAEHSNRHARIGTGQSGLNESAQQVEQNARTSHEPAHPNGQWGRDELHTGQQPNGRGDGAIGHPSHEPDSRSDIGGGRGELTAEITDAVFSNYTPQKLEINGAKPHPSKLVQSAAMASVEPPLPTYSTQLPPDVINNGLLSLAQLEAVVYAGQAHNEILPNGSRKGFFIGDGTGVGKGREISGVMLDNLMQGRKKAVWVSFSKDLMKDAQRDLAGVGGDAALIQWHGKTKINDSIKGDGIVFTSYSTLSAESKQQATDKGQTKGNSRLDQLVDWLGKDFDGVIAFDEAHSMGNAIAIKGKRGTTKPSKRALTGIALQKALPNARVVYVSATGATEINNLAYADR
ncbi:hypothetical protein BROC_02405, partial [Candidatus Brocadiaceae bacterium]